jgi:hypothetical protein
VNQGALMKTFASCTQAKITPDQLRRVIDIVLSLREGPGRGTPAWKELQRGNLDDLVPNRGCAQGTVLCIAKSLNFSSWRGPVPAATLREGVGGYLRGKIPQTDEKWPLIKSGYPVIISGQGI